MGAFERLDRFVPHDDRVGRMLERLFDGDRATLITETVLSVVREFQVEQEQLHNGSTTVTLTATDYPTAVMSALERPWPSPRSATTRILASTCGSRCSSSPSWPTARSLSPTE